VRGVRLRHTQRCSGSRFLRCSARHLPRLAIGAVAALLAGAQAGPQEGRGSRDAGAVAAAAVAPRDSAEHECHLFGYLFGDGAGSAEALAVQCQNLYEKTTLPAGDGREMPSRDGWGFAYFLTPAHSGIMGPIVIRSGAPACDDDRRWQAAREEIAAFGLGGASCVTGHVRLSSYGPDHGALPDPHPFADSLQGRWWFFSHNGHMVPDTLMSWIPPEFLGRHPLDYPVMLVDSEVLFRYCQYEIERKGNVRVGLLAALGRVKGYDDFLFNVCLSDGDTLWAAHSHTRAFYYGPLADSTAWWASTVPEGETPATMLNHHLYWFTAGGMGVESYE
jgi:hypothetical protein